MRQQQYDYWVTYVNPKSNEEMKAYGYNDNGELTLPLSELRHCEEIFPQKVLSQSRKPDPVADRFKPGSVEYGHSEYGIEIIGYVTDLFLIVCVKRIFSTADTMKNCREFRSNGM